GSKLSGALVLASANHSSAAALLARDTILFEQRGCLSPHHIFVEERTYGIAQRFAEMLAIELERLSSEFHPARGVPLDVSLQKRSIVERARWRSLSGEPVELHQGRDLGWVVVYDQNATFRPSPNYRTLTISPI